MLRGVRGLFKKKKLQRKSKYYCFAPKWEVREYFHWILCGYFGSHCMFTNLWPEICMKLCRISKYEEWCTIWTLGLQSAVFLYPFVAMTLWHLWHCFSWSCISYWQPQWRGQKLNGLPWLKWHIHNKMIIDKLSNSHSFSSPSKIVLKNIGSKVSRNLL